MRGNGGFGEGSDFKWYETPKDTKVDVSVMARPTVHRPPFKTNTNSNNTKNQSVNYISHQSLSNFIPTLVIINIQNG